MPFIPKSIKLRLNEILKKQLDFEFAGYSEEMLDQKLSGEPFGLYPRHTLCMVVDIEREFGITIPEEDILSGKFDTFNHICEIVVRQLELKKLAL